MEGMYGYFCLSQVMLRCYYGQYFDSHTRHSILRVSCHIEDVKHFPLRKLARNCCFCLIFIFDCLPFSLPFAWEGFLLRTVGT